MDEPNKFLYGASVQGIQSFIFQTNELKDIVGASALVEDICTTMFDEFGTKADPKGECVVNAAGNIKFIFNDEEACKNAVLRFPKKVMLAAPGITISQAVVRMDGDFAEFDKAVDELEKRLRTQRNRPLPSLSLGLMSVDRNRKTGLPVTQIVKEKNSNEPEYLDEGTAIKREYKDKDRGQLCVNTFGDRVKTDRFPFDVKDITGKNDWIAIIHADGNGLGQIIRKIGHDKEKLKKFSKDLSEATKAAAKKAFSSIDGEFELSKLSRLPIRPVVLGGDDFTVICRADFAVQYVRDFMKNFESETKDMGHKLTCCAGIAFIKSSFPFYYGYQLAESLCDAAKKDAKDINKDMAPSCLMFHKVQDSFVVDYSDIIKRELCISESKTTWKYGPYYLNNVEGRWTIGQLLETVKELEGDAGNAVKTSIRRWLSEMHISDKNAKQLLGRAHQIANGKARGTLEKATGYETKNGSNSQRNVKIDSEQYAAYPAYDMLSLHSVINQITK